jgi:hypothetical protein
MPTVLFVLDGIHGCETYPSMTPGEAWRAFEMELIYECDLATWECGCCVADERIRNVRWLDDHA